MTSAAPMLRARVHKISVWRLSKVLLAKLAMTRLRDAGHDEAR